MKNTNYFAESLTALNWQGGTIHQILSILKAARSVHCARQIALNTGNWENFTTCLNDLDKCFLN